MIWNTYVSTNKYLNTVTSVIVKIAVKHLNMRKKDESNLLYFYMEESRLAFFHLAAFTVMLTHF